MDVITPCNIASMAPRLIRILAGFSLLLLFGTMLAATSAGSSGTQLEPTCGVEPFAAPAQTAPVSVQDSVPWMAWMTSSYGQILNEKLQALKASDAAIQNVVPDHAAQQFVLLLEPESALAASSRQELDDIDPSSRVAVRSACRSSTEMDSIRDRVSAAIESNPDLVNGGLAISTNEAASSVIVRGDVVSADAVLRLAGVDATEVEFIDREIGRQAGGRQNDSSPHYGASRVRGLGCRFAD